MAGRGRGKGRGFTFDISSIGFGRGSEALPAATLQPPPLFPPLEKRPLPLRISQADDYMLVLKEEFRLLMNASQYCIKPDIKNKDIERYSDRYKDKQNNESTVNWEPDFSYIPTELKIKTKRSKSHHHNPLKPNIKNSKQRRLDTSAPDIDFEKLQEVDEAETDGAEKTTKANKATGVKVDEESEDDADEEDDYDEEEQEEENDYLVSHFDDDDDLGDDDDKDEGPTY